MGRGQGDGDIRTRVWGLATWGRVTKDLGTSSMGRGDVWEGDAEDVNGFSGNLFYKSNRRLFSCVCIA